MVLEQDTLSPTDVWGTVGGPSPMWWVVPLPLPHSGDALLLVNQLAAVCHTFNFLNFLLPLTSPLTQRVTLSWLLNFALFSFNLLAHCILTVLILLLLPWCKACYTLHLFLTPSPFQQPWKFNQGIKLVMDINTQLPSEHKDLTRIQR